jgi:PAT family beta-lactamase induction signal transducer AmpG
MRALVTMPFLGFASGLPLGLTSGTLQAWLTTLGLDISTIGVLSLVGLPYTVKFLWAPLMDRFALPWLGRRRGWMLATQIGLVAAIALMPAASAGGWVGILAVSALVVAFLSASQDIAFDAYRADVLKPAERGTGAGLSILGYRLAMLVSGAMALILADAFGWEWTYLGMAGLMVVGICATFASDEPPAAPAHGGTHGGVPLPVVRDGPALPLAPPRGAGSNIVVAPLRAFMARKDAVPLLFLVVLYKLGDAFAGTLTTAFLIRGVGFSLTDVGVVNKGLGLAALLVGALWGGALLARIGLYRALLGFGVLQAVTNLGFAWLALLGNDYGAMATVVALESLCGGMGTAAFVALLMALCDRRYTATQYALLSAFASIGRVVVSPTSGFAVEALGWAAFFVLTFLSAVPGLWLMMRLRHTVAALDGQSATAI